MLSTDIKLIKMPLFGRTEVFEVRVEFEEGTRLTRKTVFRYRVARPEAVHLDIHHCQSWLDAPFCDSGTSNETIFLRLEE